MTNLVLLRHGESYANVGKPTQDHQNLLTGPGVEVAIAQAKTFREQFPDLHFDAVIVSSMVRAQQTAFNFLSIVDNKAIDLGIDERLRERYFGQGDPSEYIKEYGQSAYDSWNKDVNIRPFNNGESLRDLYGRVSGAYEELVLPRLQAGETVLVVSHYFVMQCLQARVEFGHVEPAPSYHPKNGLPIPYLVPSLQNELV